MESSRLILSRIRAAYLVLRAARVPPGVSRRAAQDLSAPLPLDLAIRTGTLPNGLTFFIRHNALPDDRVMLRLAVKAGSIDEADDQRGLAHVLEHMAFNGTTHFKPGELVTYLESIGAQFGAHVNAYTSFDETVYMLDVPTDTRRRAGRAASRRSATSPAASTLDPAEIDRERGVVIEEWRGRLGAGDAHAGAADEGALRRVALHRSPARSARRRFSRASRRSGCATSIATYYRPDRMAVIVVGDIEVAGVEALVRAELLAHAGAAAATRPRLRRFRRTRTRATSSSRTARRRPRR